MELFMIFFCVNMNRTRQNQKKNMIYKLTYHLHDKIVVSYHNSKKSCEEMLMWVYFDLLSIEAKWDLYHEQTMDEMLDDFTDSELQSLKMYFIQTRNFEDFRNKMMLWTITAISVF